MYWIDIAKSVFSKIVHSSHLDSNIACFLRLFFQLYDKLQQILDFLACVFGEIVISNCL